MWATTSKRKLRSLNLNLIPVLAELLHCKNVTHAAGKLHLTQSAVSSSLRRLREIFGDELLVMRGREMVLTDKAARLLPAIDHLLTSVDSVFNEEQFDPATSVRRFRIVTADYVSALLISAFGQVLDDATPGLSLHVSQKAGTTAKEMQMGFVDLLIAPESLSQWEPFDLSSRESEFQHEICFKDSLVAIESAENPARTSPISLEEYLRRPHATFHLDHNTPASIEQETLAELNLVQNDKFIVPYFTLLPNLVTMVKDAISVVPASVAHHYSRFLPIRSFRPPIEFRAHNMIMVWARSREKDPELCWLRNAICEAAKRVTLASQKLSLES